MGEGKEENAIVTSTGQYVVAWDFAKVKKGQLDKYEIKKCVLRRHLRLAPARLIALCPHQIRPVRRAGQLQVWRRQGDCACPSLLPPSETPPSPCQHPRNTSDTDSPCVR